MKTKICLVLIVFTFTCGSNISYSQNETFREYLENNTDALEGSEAALECAALADHFDATEHNRLLNFGISEGKRSLPGLFTNILGGDLGLDENSITWEALPHENMDEFVAFQLGQTYGKYQEIFFRDIPYGSSAETWKAGYIKEFESRNCSLIGK